MLGRDVVGKQFWAVPSGEQDQQLLVLDLHEGEFSRAVVATDAPPEIAYKTFHRTDPYAHRAGADDRRIAAARAPEIRESRSAGDGRDARYRGTRDGTEGPLAKRFRRPSLPRRDRQPGLTSIDCQRRLAVVEPVAGTVNVPNPSDPEAAFASAVALRRLADRLELAAVNVAVKRGWSWTDVAAALGVTRQAAHKKFAHRVERPDA